MLKKIDLKQDISFSAWSGFLFTIQSVSDGLFLIIK